ncbi:MAG: ubiquinone/menaquinone biosynthesis methyltransferase [Candidatus Heimdallarchaeota archaeon]
MPKMTSQSIPEIQQIFDSVTRHYRLGNLLISGGTIAYTRRQAVQALPELLSHELVLDVACGPGELARSIYATQSADVGYRVVGVDLSSKMLAAARQMNGNVEHESKRLSLIQGNAFSLPFPDNTFKAIVIGYGLRNLIPRRQALKEFLRVTKEKGILVCLETSKASSFPSQLLQTLHFQKLVPAIGALLGRKEEYRYLCQSIASFPTADELKREMEAAGWIRVTMWPLLGGTVMIHTATHPKS